MNEKNFRKNLFELIQGGSTHVTFEVALKNINPEIRNLRPEPNLHSIYEELEHMRIAQEDIIKYTLDKGWKSPTWPDGYWPEGDNDITDEQWNATLNNFRKDLESVIELINNKEIDLTSEIPHGEGRTYLREILLIADHNAYHLGKIVDIRKSLGNWYN